MRGEATRDGRFPPGSPERPEPFGDYFLVGLAARGGMAEVYRATRAGTDQLFAIKVMRPGIAGDRRFVDMFRREGRLAAMLRSPSIVTTYESGEAGGIPFIAMEYLPGRDLNGVLRACQSLDERMPVPMALHVAARVLDGLHAAHNLRGEDRRPLNLVNRDVSPSNIRITFEGEVKLLDFGIARALMKFTSEIGILKGKLSYMSPEQSRGLPLDARSDIFSTGIVLYEMLSQEKLFRGDTELALLEAVRRAEVPPPSRFNRRIPAALDQVVLQALERDPSARFQSASDFADRLRELLAGYGFEVSELSDLVRRLFRREFARETTLLEALAANRIGPGVAPLAAAAPPAEPDLEPAAEGSGAEPAATPGSGFWDRFPWRRGK